MGVDYTAQSGVGFDTRCDYIDHDGIIELLKTKSAVALGDEDLLEYIYELQDEGFDIKPYGDYCYSGDEEDLGLLIVKKHYKDDDIDFVRSVNGFFGIELSADLIDMVEGVWVI